MKSTEIDVKAFYNTRDEVDKLAEAVQKVIEVFA